MPKGLLKKAIREVETSRTSTRSLANNPAFLERALPGYASPPASGQIYKSPITSQDLRELNGQQVCLSLSNGSPEVSSHGYVLNGVVYAYAGVILDEQRRMHLQVLNLNPGHIKHMIKTPVSQNSTERKIMQNALEARAKGKRTLTLRLDMYT